MAMRWRLWKDDFHTSMYDFNALYADDEGATPCKCSGRGHPLPQLSQLRLPKALLKQMEAEGAGRKGKGRANVLQQRVSRSKEPGRRHKSSPLDEICSVSSEDACSSRSFFGQFSDQLLSQMDRPFSDSGRRMDRPFSDKMDRPFSDKMDRPFSDKMDRPFSDSGCRVDRSFSDKMDRLFSNSGRRRHILYPSDNIDNADDGNRPVFGVKVEEPQLDLKRDFPPLVGGQDCKSSERGSTKSLGCIGDIILGSIGPDDKGTTSEETKENVVESGGPELSGDNVVAIRGFPTDCEETVLMEMLSPYGKILQCQRSSSSDDLSATFLVRYETPEACEWATSCLHNTEGLPGSPITVERQAEPAKEDGTPDSVDLPGVEQ